MTVGLAAPKGRIRVYRVCGSSVQDDDVWDVDLR
jgi:hypothetical protein